MITNITLNVGMGIMEIMEIMSYCIITIIPIITIITKNPHYGNVGIMGDMMIKMMLNQAQGSRALMLKDSISYLQGENKLVDIIILISRRFYLIVNKQLIGHLKTGYSKNLLSRQFSRLCEDFIPFYPYSTPILCLFSPFSPFIRCIFPVQISRRF